MGTTDQPLSESLAIQRLRNELERVTSALETLIADGFPMRPMSRSREGVDEWEQWHLNMDRRIADAREALILTESFDLAGSESPGES